MDRHPLEVERPDVPFAACTAADPLRLAVAVPLRLAVPVVTFVVDHHHVGQVGHAVRHFRQSGPQGPRHHHDPGARIGQLVA